MNSSDDNGPGLDDLGPEPDGGHQVLADLLGHPDEFIRCRDMKHRRHVRQIPRATRHPPGRPTPSSTGSASPPLATAAGPTLKHDSDPPRNSPKMTGKLLATSDHVDCKDEVVERFETASLALLPGQRVKARVLSHHPWGVSVQIVGCEHLGASVDMIQQFARTILDHEELLKMYPPVGAEIDAVVEQVRRFSEPAWVRLSLRLADLVSFQWPCDFCGDPTTLSEGGDGLVLDVRSNDGPGSHTVISHRTCLAERIRPENAGERARALKVGRPEQPPIGGSRN